MPQMWQTVPCFFDFLHRKLLVFERFLTWNRLLGLAGKAERLPQQSGAVVWAVCWHLWVSGSGCSAVFRLTV